MKTEKNESRFYEKIENFKKSFEKKSFHIGNRSIPLTTLAIYLCCLCCAILIWANVSESSDEKITREFNDISITVEGESALLKKGKAVFDVIDDVVSVTVNGSKTKVNALSDDEIKAYVDVSELDESGTVRLSVNVKGTGKLDTTVTPSMVKLFVDEKGEIDVPVVVNSTYSIVSDYNFSVTSDIDSVAVNGAKSVLGSVVAARVDADLGELTTGFTTTCGLLLVDAEGKEIPMDYITPAISSVLVSVNVFTEKTVPLTVSYKYGYIQPKNISVKLTPSSITLRGDPALLSGIDSIALPEIDETKITGDIFKSVTVNLPLGVTDVNKTETFTEEVKLLKVEKRTITLPTSKITVKNPDGITYAFEEKNIDIEYIVASDSKAKVKESDFIIEIDLSDYDHDADGKYKIPLSVTVDNSGYTLYPINIGQIDVKITGTDKAS